jgi:hypothetical protein
MRSISRFEADLLRILHALLGRAPLEGARPLIAGRHARPRCLGRGAVELVQDALAKGCVWRLAREGGWLPDRYLRGDRVAAGRLWERTLPEDLGLSFSRYTLGFLIWLTADHPADRPVHWNPGERDLTIGDRLLLFYGYEALRAGLVDPAKLRDVLQFPRHALCRLAFPEDFIGARPGVGPDYSTWTGGLGACVLEALQPYLAARWVALERQKLAINDPTRMIALGRAQEATLRAFLDAIDGAGRPDLARFFLSAASTLLRDARGPRAWVGSLNLGGLRLAERAEVHRAALAFLRSFDRLRAWERRARGVGYFDEGYAASQLWKAEWGAHAGDTLCEQAAAIGRAVDPLGSGAVAVAAGEG